MSNETEKKNEQQTERKLTKYDQKIQRREEQRRKEERDSKIFNIVGVLVIIALIALIASFPIRSYMAVNGTVCTVDGENISRVKFDYYYNNFKSSYINNYGYYLQAFYGMDLSGDMKDVSYDGNLSFHDYFEQETVDQLTQNAALKKELTAAGFTYDVSADYAKYQKSLAAAIEASGQSVKDYYQSNFGPYATESRLADVVKENLLITAFYKEKNKSFLPTDAEIDANYAENTDTYDFVDFRLTSVAAEIPTEPTELADEGAEVAEDGSYTASEAEIEKAMADAKVLADEAEETISENGTLYEGYTKSRANSYVSSWLFEEGRKEGDTTVITDESSHTYYAVEFIARYQDTEPTHNIRVAACGGDKTTEMQNAFAAAGSDEAAFISLVNEYSEISTDEGGLFEGMTADTLGGEMDEWMAASERAFGDFYTHYDEEEDSTYAIFYVGKGQPSWYYTIQGNLQSDAMSEYLTSIKENITVDTKDLEYAGKLAAEDVSGNE